MQYSSFFLLSIVLSAFACNAREARACVPPSGRFINTTVLDKCPGSMPSEIPHFCFALNFRGVSNVEVDNGFEKFTVAWSPTEDGCRFKIAGASLFGDMYFTIDSDSTLQLIDTAWTKLKTFTTFKKTKDPVKTNWSFEQYLNDCIISGEYALFKNGNLMPGVITFMSNGQMNGMRPYLGYEICYAGDCLEETDPPARTIDLMNQKGGKDTYVFKMVSGKMSIELYSIGEPIPDMKGGRSIGPMVYELRTE